MLCGSYYTYGFASMSSLPLFSQSFFPLPISQIFTFWHLLIENPCCWTFLYFLNVKYSKSIGSTCTLLKISCVQPLVRSKHFILLLHYDSVTPDFTKKVSVPTCRLAELSVQIQPRWIQNVTTFTIPSSTISFPITLCQPQPTSSTVYNMLFTLLQCRQICCLVATKKKCLRCNPTR